MADKLKITHTILFCKGWYVHSHHTYDKLWEDMKSYIEKDGYFPPQSLKETVLFLVNKIENHKDLFDDCRLKENPLFFVFTEIDRRQFLYEECKDNVWAAAFGVLYGLLQGLNKDAFECSAPDYETFEMPDDLKERLKEEPNFIKEMFGQTK